MSKTSRDAPRMSSRGSPNTLGQIMKHFLGLASGRLLVLMTICGFTARLLVGDFRWGDVAIISGVLIAWPFIEWFVHLCLLHFQPTDVPARTIGPFQLPAFRLDPTIARIHRAHHRDPWRLDHVMVPLHTYGISLPINLVFWFSLFEPGRALTGATMIFLLGLHYELVHLMAHCRWKPPLGYYRRRWRNHRLHHCKSEKHWLGITMLLGDVVMGTGGHPRSVETSPTCRSLGYEEETLSA